MKNTDSLELNRITEKIEYSNKIQTIVNSLEDKVVKLQHKLTYDQILDTAIVIAEVVRENTPMYTGNLNPVWKAWDDVIEQLKTRK
jgi:hypothetical protein